MNDVNVNDVNIDAPIKTTQVEKLPVRVYEDEEAMGRAAAADAADIVRRALR